MIFIVVRKSDNLVVSQGSSQVVEAKKDKTLYSYYDDVDDAYVIGGTYDGVTYTAAE